MVADSFGRFAQDRIAPVAEHVHRTNGDIPDEVLEGLAELGGFGLSVPEEYGGFATGGESDYMGMVVATEELSRASLGVGGSLITRPEILTRALVKGGTEEQRKHWLPQLATGETLVAVAVTEPDFGSDVAGMTTTATKSEGGWVINGVKTWCTFAARANVLMLLARTNPDKSAGHRGLSLLVVPKPVGEGEGFRFEGEKGGTMEGRPIDTIGYRGMHSYEVALDNWWVPEESLIGGEEGIGRGFYLTMEGFENGRLQTAARAVGLMQAAVDAAATYAKDRKVFGRAVADYQLTQVKLARMAAVTQVTRQNAYRVATLMAKGEGTLEVAMLKAFVCRAARVGHPRSDADPRRHGLRRGVPGEPLLRRRPSSLHLRRGRRDPGPQGGRSPPRRADRPRLSLRQGDPRRSKDLSPSGVSGFCPQNASGRGCPCEGSGVAGSRDDRGLPAGHDGQTVGHRFPRRRVPALGGGGDGAVHGHVDESGELSETEGLDDCSIGVSEDQRVLSLLAEEGPGPNGVGGAQEGDPRVGLLEHIENPPGRRQQAATLVGVGVDGHEGQMESGEPGPEWLGYAGEGSQLQVRRRVRRHGRDGSRG